MYMRSVDVVRVWRRRRERSALLADVMERVRVRSAGLSRSQVRELMAAELGSRRLSPPAGEGVLDAMTDSVLAGGDLTTRVRLAGQVVRGMAGKAGGVGRVLTGGLVAGAGLAVADGIVVRPDMRQSPLSVLGEPERAGPGGDGDAASRVRPLPGRAEIFVLLEEAEDGCVAVVAGGRRVGLLTEPGSRLFDEVLRLGREQGRPVVAEAVCERLGDGSEQVTVYRPCGWSS